MREREKAKRESLASRDRTLPRGPSSFQRLTSKPSTE
jgi:hypothetical protein